MRQLSSECYETSLSMQAAAGPESQCRTAKGVIGSMPAKQSMEASITFIIPAFNEERLIPFAIRSIKGEMAGRPNDYEILVVDNASTDRTSEVARGPM